MQTEFVNYIATVVGVPTAEQTRKWAATTLVDLSHNAVVINVLEHDQRLEVRGRVYHQKRVSLRPVTDQILLDIEYVIDRCFNGGTGTVTQIQVSR